MANETPTTGAAIRKLAKEKFQKRKRAAAKVDYKTGKATEKVWDNYQLTKELKREFKDLCRDKGINASSFLRSCVRLLIKREGDIAKALEDAKKIPIEEVK